MAQTASGFLRIAALLIATAVFATVWNGDQQTQQQYVIARKAAGGTNHGMLLTRRDAEPSRTAARTNQRPEQAIPTLVGHRSAINHRCRAAVTSYVARVEIEMPLPVGIVPGRYQIVDQTGAVQSIRVATASGPIERRDVYTLDHSDGSRRFFIRLIETAAERHDSRRR